MISLEMARTAARLSLAAYDDSDAGAVADAISWGFEAAKLVYVPDGSALIGHRDGFTWIDCSGTHFFDRTNMAEVVENFDCAPVRDGAGIVAAGYRQHADDVWQVIRPELSGGPYVLSGHSLGGVTAHLLRPRLKADVKVFCITFGAPMGADAAWYDSAYAGMDLPLRVVNENDAAPGWPTLSGFTQPPAKLVWLHGGGAALVDEQGGMDDDWDDHDPQRYVDAMAALTVWPL